MQHEPEAFDAFVITPIRDQVYAVQNVDEVELLVLAFDLAGDRLQVFELSGSEVFHGCSGLKSSYVISSMDKISSASAKRCG